MEKILRIQETAERLRCPLFYLVDLAERASPTRSRCSPGAGGLGRIFYNQVRLSGKLPQICLLFGPSAAGGAYIPAFCDVVIMVDGNASMYLGSPECRDGDRGEGVARRDGRRQNAHLGIGVRRRVGEDGGGGNRLCPTVLRVHALHWEARTPVLPPKAISPGAKPLASVVVRDENKPFDMKQFIEGLVDEGSFLEIKRRFAKELITGFARLEGKAVGIIANQPKHLGGILFVDSADKAARFIWLCDAFNIHFSISRMYPAS